MTVSRFTRYAATAAIPMLVIAACSSDDGGPSSQPSTTVPATTAPTSSVPATTTPATSAPGTSSPSTTGRVTPADLTAAETAVLTFVESLGRGDIDAAASVVGPVSEANANDAGGLRSMLQQSTEGHGTWLAATNRTVTPIGVDLGLVAVVLEGTLRVEGTTEHRVAVFPARKAESAATWFVEPWAHAIAADPPLRITNPIIDAEERATVGASWEVSVETDAPGTVWTSFDAQPPTDREVTGNGTVTMRPATGGADVVMVLFQSGPLLYGSGFRVSR